MAKTSASTRSVHVPVPGSYEESAGRVLGTAPAITEWANEPDVQKLKDDLMVAQPSQESQVIKIDRWIALREAAPKTPGSKEKGANRSTIQPKLVRRQAEWRYAALTEPFLSAEKLFKVSPRTWQDVEAAKQNDLLLNWQTSTKINRVDFIDEYVRTGVDEGTVIVRPGWVRDSHMEEVEEPIWDFYPATTPEQVELLNQAITLMQEDPQEAESLPEELQVAAEESLARDMPLIAVHAGTQLVERERVTRNHPILDILDYRNVYIDPTCNGIVDRANFAVISFETSKAELTKDGRYKNLEYVNWSANGPLNQPNHATSDLSHTGFSDELRKRVVAYEYWGFYDVEGTGTLTPIVATWIGDTMIRMERNPYPDQKIPLVVVKYLPVRKSIAGEPDAELLEDNQQILGATIRGMIDLLGRSANGQTGFAKGMLDTVNRRRYDHGLDYEFNPNMGPEVGIHSHKFPEIPNSAMVMLQLQNQEAEALTGVKAFSEGLTSGSLGDVATGIRGMLDAAAKREMGILRRFAQGIEEIGRRIIAMNAMFLSDQEVVRVTDEEFVTISREALEGEVDLVVDIATSEVDEKKAADLGFLLQTLGNTVPWEITREILAEIAELKRMPALARAIRKYEPQPDPLEEKMKELTLAKLEMEISEMQAQTQLHMARAQETMAKARLAGSTADKTDLDFIEQETGTKHVRDIDKQQAQAAANERLAITKEAVKARFNPPNTTPRRN